MRNPLLFLLFLIAALISQSIGKEYTLQELLKLAEKRNKDIQLAQTDLNFAAAQKKEAWATALPKVNVDFNYNRNFLENFFYVNVTDSLGRTQTNKFVVSFNNEFQLNATLSQTIFGFGKIGNAITAANYFDRFTRFRYNYRRQSVITQIKKSFYTVLLLQKVWEVAQQSEINARENYQNMKLKYESGAVSEFDLLQAEVRWKNAIPETIKSRKDFQLALNNLRVLVDLPRHEEISLKGNLEQVPPLPPKESMGEVLAARPDFQSLQWEKKLREKRVAVEFSNHLPTITGNLIYAYGARSNAFRLENANDNIILGLNLHIPLFSGGLTSARVQQARVDVKRVKIQIALMKDNIDINLENIFLRLDEARQRIEAAQSSVDVAQRAFEIAESRAQNGLATQLELKDSRVLLDRAKLTYYSAIYDYLNAYFDYELATGKVRIE